MTADIDRSAPPPPGADSPRARRAPRWLAALAGLAAALLGLVPWLLTGAELPLQNLWDAAAPPERMPLALLPFSQYALVLVWALPVVGVGIAGIVGRALRLPFGACAGDVPVAVQGLLPLVRWVPPVLVGAAIGWAGIASVGRAVAAVVVAAALLGVRALRRRRGR